MIGHSSDPVVTGSFEEISIGSRPDFQPDQHWMLNGVPKSDKG
jgi:hypothetical protein